MENNIEKIQTFEDLKTWQEGHKLVIEIYKITRDFPKEEMFGLTSQMRRSAVSVTSNIAEGFSRTTRKDKYQFYAISKGSLTELQSQLCIAKDITYMDKECYERILDQITIVGKLLTGLQKYLKTNPL